MTRRQQAGAGGLVILLIVGAYIVAFIGWASPQIAKDTCTVSNAKCPHDTYALGTWYNFPSATTEFMNNQTYERPFGNSAENGAGSFSVQLMVNCITASNTANAFLQLQYANVSQFIPPYPSSSFGYAFLGPWTNLTGPAYIDGNGGPNVQPSCINGPTPGSTPWILSTSGSLPPVIGANYDGFYLLRVVGGGGGGVGDNPRFGGIFAMIGQTTNFVQTMQVTTKSTTQFTARVTVAYPAFVPITTNFDWQASNSTVGTLLTRSGSSSCNIPKNSLFCQSIISFGITFPAAPKVFTEVTSVPTNFVQTYPPIAIFSPETTTV